MFSGGFGEGVLEMLNKENFHTPVLTLAVPDEYIEHATIAEQLKACGLTAMDISNRIQRKLKELSEARI